MKKILSILLAVVFFITSTGFTISSHKCGGKVHKQNINLTAENLNCGMEESEKDSCTDNEIQGNCCQNEFQNFKITDDYQRIDFGSSFEIQHLIAFTYTLTELVLENKTYAKHLIYTPPLPDEDIPVLIQSFLI
jgi:hypothetical protein